MGFDLSGLLQQYLGSNAPSTNDAQSHFDQVAQNVSPSTLSQGLAAMFHSDQTPSLGHSASRLFGQANSNQQAGMLNQLIAGMGLGGFVLAIKQRWWCGNSLSIG